MKKFLVFSFAIMFAITPFFAVNFAFAASDYVDTNVDFVQGLTKDGSAIDVSRSDETMALGMEDGNFVSLGYGGVIELAFPTHIGGASLSITAYERTNGDYPLEEAEVWVSGDGSNWTMLGVANNLVEGDPSRPTIFTLRDDCIKYVKLVDITDPNLHRDSSDGFDLDAIGAEYESECNLEEPCDECCDAGHDIVINDNEATVMNRVSSHANTGGNYASGSYGGDGGDAGNIHGGDVNQSTTGNGGDGGDASTGGTIFTGNAYATTSFNNEVNSNTTIIDRCACDNDGCCDGGHDVVYNRNRAIVVNDVSSYANTGDNMADGSYAGRGGDGGSINPYEGPVIRILDDGEEYNDDGRVDESITGEGGAGGNGGEGGFVQTGESRSNTVFVNVVNRNLTRILR